MTSFKPITGTQWHMDISFPCNTCCVSITILYIHLHLKLYIYALLSQKLASDAQHKGLSPYLHCELWVQYSIFKAPSSTDETILEAASAFELPTATVFTLLPQVNIRYHLIQSKLIEMETL